jgi:hypothetical protein
MNRHSDEASLATSCSLPSLLNIKGDRFLFPAHDFAKSTPISYGKKADIWGTTAMPPLPRYRSIFEDSPEEAELKRQKSLHEEQEKAKAEDKVRKQSDAKVRRNSLLGLGYNYHSQGDLLKPEKKSKPRGLKPAKKVSKHSTTIRNLRPEVKKKTPVSGERQQQQGNEQKEQQEQHQERTVPKRRHSRIPGPLPRVLQRAKIQRMLNKAQEHLQAMVSGNANKVPIKKAISLKDAGRDVIAGIRSESMRSRSNLGIKHWEKYFGEAAKTDFYRQYHVARKSALFSPNFHPSNLLSAPPFILGI